MSPIFRRHSFPGVAVVECIAADDEQPEDEREYTPHARPLRTWVVRYLASRLVAARTEDDARRLFVETGGNLNEILAVYEKAGEGSP